MALQAAAWRKRGHCEQQPTDYVTFFCCTHPKKSLGFLAEHLDFASMNLLLELKKVIATIKVMNPYQHSTFNGNIVLVETLIHICDRHGRSLGKRVSSLAWLLFTPHSLFFFPAAAAAEGSLKSFRTESLIFL